jgi:hypothetical protein
MAGAGSPSSRSYEGRCGSSSRDMVVGQLASLQKSFNNMHKLDEDGTETSVGGGGEFDICKGSC